MLLVSCYLDINFLQARFESLWPDVLSTLSSGGKKNLNRWSLGCFGFRQRGWGAAVRILLLRSEKSMLSVRGNGLFHWLQFAGRRGALRPLEGLSEEGLSFRPISSGGSGGVFLPKPCFPALPLRTRALHVGPRPCLVPTPLPLPWPWAPSPWEPHPARGLAHSSTPVPRRLLATGVIRRSQTLLQVRDAVLSPRTLLSCHGSPSSL